MHHRLFLAISLHFYINSRRLNCCSSKELKKKKKKTKTQVITRVDVATAGFPPLGTSLERSRTVREEVGGASRRRTALWVLPCCSSPEYCDVHSSKGLMSPSLPHLKSDSPEFASHSVLQDVPYVVQKKKKKTMLTNKLAALHYPSPCSCFKKKKKTIPTSRKTKLFKNGALQLQNTQCWFSEAWCRDVTPRIPVAKCNNE